MSFLGNHKVTMISEAGFTQLIQRCLANKGVVEHEGTFTWKDMFITIPDVPDADIVAVYKDYDWEGDDWLLNQNETNNTDSALLFRITRFQDKSELLIGTTKRVTDNLYEEAKGWLREQLTLAMLEGYTKVTVTKDPVEVDGLIVRKN